ncbi:uncharacterized protein [Amphiura filiformis]|uniref:uncharacterized protein n=1 Tax=Amphiura filiformis TaxID=82378 RepID=UPI003B21928F
MCLRTSPKCLNCCLLTGNVVVGLNNSLAVFKFVIHNKGTDTEYKDFTHLLDIVVSFPVKEVALTQQYVAFASSHQLHCFKLTFGDWTHDQIGVKTASKTDNLAEFEADREHTVLSLKKMIKLRWIPGVVMKH